MLRVSMRTDGRLRDGAWFYTPDRDGRVRANGGSAAATRPADGRLVVARGNRAAPKTGAHAELAYVRRNRRGAAADRPRSARRARPVADGRPDRAGNRSPGR